jgi:hypothetical protein
MRTALLAAIDADDFVQPATSYWGRAVSADLALTQALLKGDVGSGDTVATLAARYVDVFGERSAARERNSSVRHLWDLVRIAQDAALTASLTELVTTLGHWRPGS